MYGSRGYTDGKMRCKVNNLAIISTTALSVIVTISITGFIATVKSFLKLFKIIKKAQSALIRDRIVQGHAYFMEKESIELHALRSFEEMYSAYKNLGENGFVDQLMEDIHELNIKK